MKVAVRQARNGGILMSSMNNSESTRRKYEPPCAMRLSDAASGVAAENCLPGSNASGNCTSGVGAVGNCLAGPGFIAFLRRKQGQSSGGR